MANTLAAILILEDDETNQALYQDILAEDYCVYLARDVLEATDLLTHKRLDLLILDLDLPVINGVEFILLIRDEPSLARLPILVISGGSNLINQLVPDQVQGILQKPFSLSELTALVAETINTVQAVWPHAVSQAT